MFWNNKKILCGSGALKIGDCYINDGACLGLGTLEIGWILPWFRDTRDWMELAWILPWFRDTRGSFLGLGTLEIGWSLPWFRDIAD